jgi:CIC family chloride channel protein
VFAIELLLTSVNARTLLLVACATATAAYISHLLLGVQPSFYIPQLEYPEFHLEQAWALLLFFPLGALIGLLSVAFIRGIYGFEDIFDRIPGNYYTRHALGMFCVGVMMYLMLRYTGHYYIEGVGYATIMDVLQGILTNPWLLLLLLFLKLLATSLSLGSGASGGVFSPALFMGASGGAAFGQLSLAAFPTLQMGIPTFAIAGMAASIGGSTGAVLTGIIMVTEMTRDPRVALPLIIAVSTAYAVRRLIMRESIYTMKLIRRGRTVPEGLQTSLATRTAHESMTSDFATREKGAATPANVQVVVIEDQDRIVDVIGPPADAGAHSTSQRFVIVGEQDDMLTVLENVESAGADLALVSRNPAMRAVKDIVGVLTRAHLAALIREQKELL